MRKTEHSTRKKARALLNRTGYKGGGAVNAKTAKEIADHDVHEHEHAMHPHRRATKLKDGGVAEGRAMGGRPDRKPRGASGGKKGGHTTVNVVVPHGAPQAMPVPVPHPMPMPPPQGAAGPPGGMPMGPPKPPGAMPPPGMGGMKKGGHVKKMKGYPIDDGAGGGEGRLEKAKAYGART